jgi:aminoglycoside 3-N-acetyltransferase
MVHAISPSEQPFTLDDLERDLRALGLAAGDTVLVHSSLSSIGYVVGGARTLVSAMLNVIGADGTLVVPTHSGDLSDPGKWVNPPVPETWWPILRSHMPAYDPAVTPTRTMGTIPELVRHLPGALRSAHPAMSFCALGPNAEFITSGHGLAFGFDEFSPLARLYDLNARVLLLGVDHDRDTSIHLGEFRYREDHEIVQEGAPVLVNGQRQWVTFDTLEYNNDDFVQLGVAFRETGGERVGHVGVATARLFSQPQLVDFSVEWFRANRL